MARASGDLMSANMLILTMVTAIERLRGANKECDEDWSDVDVFCSMNLYYYLCMRNNFRLL